MGAQRTVLLDGEVQKDRVELLRRHAWTVVLHIKAQRSAVLKDNPHLGSCFRETIRVVEDIPEHSTKLFLTHAHHPRYVLIQRNRRGAHLSKNSG